MSNNNPYILGGAQSDFAERWSAQGDTERLLRQVLDNTLENIALSYKELEHLKQEDKIGIFVGNFVGERLIPQGNLGSFLSRIHPALAGAGAVRYEAACASGGAALDAARSKIRAGELDLALVVGLEVMHTVNARECNDTLGLAAHYESESARTEFAFPRIFGRFIDAVLERQPELKEKRLLDALWAISDKNRANARRNPFAQTRKLGSSRREMERLNARYRKSLGNRTRFSDCAQITDGAVMLAMASPRYARAKRMATLAGRGFRTTRPDLESKLANGNSPLVLPWTRRAIDDALSSARLRPEDLDVIETHDCFAISEYLALSHFGIADPGREYEALEDGRTTHTGHIPVNPSGGLIGAGHPVGATGVRMALDLFKQVTGQAGDCQVEGAKNGAMLNIGGSFATNACFVVSQVDL